MIGAPFAIPLPGIGMNSESSNCLDNVIGHACAGSVCSHVHRQAWPCPLPCRMKSA